MQGARVFPPGTDRIDVVARPGLGGPQSIGEPVLISQSGINFSSEPGLGQVRSLTQFYSVDFSKSRIGVKKSAFSTNAQSRFASVVLDSVLGPLRLAHT